MADVGRGLHGSRTLRALVAAVGLLTLGAGSPVGFGAAGSASTGERGPGDASSPDTEAPACDPNATCAPRTPYRFELGNATLDQDLTLDDVDAVEIRDVRVFGDLAIEVAEVVMLDRVFVAGSLRLTDARNVSLRDVTVGRDLRLQKVGPFAIAHARVGGDLVCRTVCADGSLDEVAVGAALRFSPDEVFNVTRSNVRVGAVALAPPAQSPAPAGQVRLDVTPANRSFAHERALDLAESVGKVEVRLDVDPEAARAQLRLANESGPLADAPRLDAGFEKLLEFEDRNGDGSLDLGDRVLREVRLPDLRPRSVRQERLTGDREGWRSRVEFDVGGGGLLTLSFTTRDASGDATKIDVEVAGYAFASEASRLALQVRLASDRAWTFVPGDAADQVRFLGGSVDGFFAWVRSARVDGENTIVRARLIDERDDLGLRSSAVLLLSYERGERIAHDPTIGVAPASATDGIVGPIGDRAVYAAALGSTLVLLWALARSARRAKP